MNELLHCHIVALCCAGFSVVVLVYFVVYSLSSPSLSEERADDAVRGDACFAPDHLHPDSFEVLNIADAHLACLLSSRYLHCSADLKPHQPKTPTPPTLKQCRPGQNGGCENGGVCQSGICACQANNDTTSPLACLVAYTPTHAYSPGQHPYTCKTG